MRGEQFGSHNCFFKSDPNLEDRPRYIHVKISPGEKGVLLIQKGNWTYQNLALE